VTALDAARVARADAAQLLDEAALLVARGWCQHALALDGDGRLVEPWSGDAQRWSALGALLGAWYESPIADATAFRRAYVALAFATGGRVDEWNAARWREQHHVVSAFGRARTYLPADRSRTATADGADEHRPAAVRSDVALVGVPAEPAQGDR
jgi:hypothetical protein